MAELDGNLILAIARGNDKKQVVVGEILDGKKVVIRKFFPASHFDPENSDVDAPVFREIIEQEYYSPGSGYAIIPAEEAERVSKAIGVSLVGRLNAIRMKNSDKPKPSSRKKELKDGESKEEE